MSRRGGLYCLMYDSPYRKKTPPIGLVLCTECSDDLSDALCIDSDIDINVSISQLYLNCYALAVFLNTPNSCQNLNYASHSYDATYVVISNGLSLFALPPVL